MKKLTEGRMMFISVMAIFMVYGIIFIVFEDYDRRMLEPLKDEMDWHLLWFSVVVMAVLGLVLHRYSRQMDRRISQERDENSLLMRRQLTQNISHELKTPVASILGYMETILDNPDMNDDVKRQFITRSHTQALRLTALLRDLSTLNRMDYAPDLLEKEVVDLSKLVADVVEETALVAAQRHMNVVNHLPDGITVKGNPSLLYSIFRNLIDNAISYAGTETTVTIAAERHKDQWEFTFSDNGAGVADEHLPRLFERFYRVDKGRSRKMGGTGLGLAIVKNAVLLHGGSISVSCQGGLRFLFTLSAR